MKKTNSEKNRKIGITLIDVFCILLAFVILFFLGTDISRALPLTPTTGGDVKTSYVLTVSNVPESILSQIQSNQLIYDSATGKTLGTISSIINTPYIITGINLETGQAVANTVEGRYNLNITVTASAEEVDNNYVINGVTVACGLNYDFRTSQVALSGTCVSLKTN